MEFPIGRKNLLCSVKKFVDESNINTPFSNKHSEYVNRARGSVTEIKIKNWFKEVHEIFYTKRSKQGL